MVDLSKRTILIRDRGAFSYLAQFLALFYGKVQYSVPESGLYTKSPESKIGEGLPGVELVEDFYKALEKTDVVFFPYIYDGALQRHIRSLDIPLCGTGSAEAEQMELHKNFFKTKLKEAGLKNIPTKMVTGIDEARKIVKGMKKAVLKSAERHRGDFETFTHRNPYETNLYLDDVEHALGIRAKTIKILIEEWMDDIDVETGADGFMLDGIMAPNCTVGVEVKDKAYICRVFQALPTPILETQEKLRPEYARTGYRGPYHNEMFILKDGTVERLDETLRCGSPNTPVLCEMYGEMYAQAIWSLAHGEMPSGTPLHQFGAELILSSTWHIKHQLWVGCPKGFEGSLKLHNAIMRKGQYFCIPDLSEDASDEFGSVVGYGASMEEAIKKCLAAAEEIEAIDLSYKEGAFDDYEETLEALRRHDIDF